MMVLRITFRDGSNPWVTYGNYKEIRAAWKKWENNPNAAPLIWGFVPGWYVRIDTGIPGRAPAYYLEDPEGRRKIYSKLGNALRALDRLTTRKTKVRGLH